jgi:hypothetical protein
MGLIRASGRFCYLQCDALNCNKKMEHFDKRTLRSLAKLCGWEERGDEWICWNCAEKPDGRGKGSPKSKEKVASAA